MIHSVKTLDLHTCSHGHSSLAARHIFQFRGARKQDVIFQMDMLVQVNFQRCLAQGYSPQTAGGNTVSERRS